MSLYTGHVWKAAQNTRATSTMCKQTIDVVAAIIVTALLTDAAVTMCY